MIVEYILKEIVGEHFTHPEILKEQSEPYCCGKMEMHIRSGTFYVYEQPESRLAIESYDHNLLDVYFCPGCGQRVMVSCLGKQMVKRDENGVAQVPVGGLKKW